MNSAWSAELIEGTVVRAMGAICDVRTEVGDFRCVLRGRLRKELVYPTSHEARRTVQTVRRMATGNPVATGDRVLLRRIDRDSGVIEEVLPRERSFTRQAAGDANFAQTLLTGIDQLIVVFAVQEPSPRLTMLDRFLVIAEYHQTPALICFNKADLGVEEAIAHDIATYRRIGYRVILTSSVEGIGLPELRAELQGKISALVGPSGVGKTSLLNELSPGIEASIGEVNPVTGKGRHITRQATLYPLDEQRNSMIIDTPGLRQLAFWEVDHRALDECFPEMRPHLGHCRFSECSHVHEPDCAVRSAVSDGEIDQRRYESYLRLRG